MDKIATTYFLKNKGIYYFLTKYIILFGFFIIVSVVLIESISYNNIIRLRLAVFTICIGIFFLMCQIILSRIFPHRVELFADKMKFGGPWSIGTQTINMESIKSIEFNEERFVIIPKWPSFNKVTICRSLDPEKEIRNTIFNTLKARPGIVFIENAQI